jgi:ABC-2 type transport system ATP-binding protein
METIVKTDREDWTGREPANGADGAAVLVDGITKWYADHTALAAVSLQVPAGSVLSLLGPNGAGKTTLIRILTTLIRPDAGRALVAGHDVVAEPQAVRSRIGLVGQHAAIDEYLTGRENLTLVGRLLRLGKAELAERVGASLEAFSLVEVADAPASTYSGGTRRRLDLAVTLLTRPAVVFLDEPTTGLDPASRRELWALVDDLVAGGTTILLTTQYLEEADRLADTVAVLERGRIIETGTPDQLKARLQGDSLHLRLADPGALAAGVVALAEMGEVNAVDHDHGELEVRVQNGAWLLPDALRRLDRAGLATTAAEVRRPGLDDVFLALTGRPADQRDTDRDAGGGTARHRHFHHHRRES